jgi:hypothetical protein
MISYPEIREIEVAELARALRSPPTAASTREKLMAKLDDFGRGKIAHCSESIVSLVDALLDAQSIIPAPLVPEAPRIVRVIYLDCNPDSNHFIAVKTRSVKGPTESYHRINKKRCIRRFKGGCIYE